jgi:hypothetical protein
MMLRKLSAAAQILPESHQRIHSFAVEFVQQAESEKLSAACYWLGWALPLQDY